MASMRASSRRIGGRSVSGYMRSAPGRMRSKPFVPSSSAWRVSLGTPRAASRARMAISRAAVSTSARSPQTTMMGTSLSTPQALPTRPHSVLDSEGTFCVETTRLGSVSRQAMTRTRSLNSFRNDVRGCVGTSSRPWKPGSGHAPTTAPCATAWAM